MQDKIIFLDFDGVITLPPYWNINVDKLKNLKKIVDATNAKIVISSSWRGLDLASTKESIFKNIKRCARNKMINWFEDNIYDITPVAGFRGEEIQKWIDSHDIENYVILDDDSDMLDSQWQHFVQTNYEFGITEQQIGLSIKVLNNEIIYNKLGLNSIINYAWLLKCDGMDDNLNKLLKYEQK